LLNRVPEVHSDEIVHVNVGEHVRDKWLEKSQMVVAFIKASLEKSDCGESLWHWHVGASLYV